MTVGLMAVTITAPQHPMRELLYVPHYVIRYGIAERAMPHALPSWLPVYQQSPRWLAADVSRRWHRACGLDALRVRRPDKPTDGGDHQ